MAAMFSVAAFACAGCENEKDASKSNFQRAIQAYFDSLGGACIGVNSEELPYTKETDLLGFGDKSPALVSAGLLSSRRTKMPLAAGQATTGTEFSLTDIGKKHLVKHRPGFAGKTIALSFCTGKYEVASVDNFTEPSAAMGTTVSEVDYHYKLADAADWIKTPAILEAYPQFAGDLKDSAAARAIMILTANGWIRDKR